MPLLFRFTDAPNIDDQWETSLDVDVLIHTRPPLLAERDRFATNYGTSFAQTELQHSVISGLKAYGYNILSSIHYLVSDSMLKLEREAYSDRIAACQAVGRSCDNPDDIQTLADFAERERILWAEILDSPEIIDKFVHGPLTTLAQLDPIARMDVIYDMRAARLALDIPFSRNADSILAQLFVQTPESDPYNDITHDTFSSIREVLISDIIAGLIDRLETNTDFLDQILIHWVIPKLQERFLDLDDEIEQYRQIVPGRSITREDYITRRKADPTWLALAKKLGSPVPKPIISSVQNS